MAAPIRPDDDAHEQAEELLPWYATGQLNGSDRVLVERHLTSCAECQKQLRFEQRMIEEFQDFSPEVDSGWARLRARIEPGQPGQRWQPARPGAMRGALGLLRRPAVATLAAAQLAVVVLAGGAFLSLSKPEYRALSSSTPPAAGNVIVIFRSDATQEDVLDALRASGASLVGGPTSADAYLLRVPANRRAAAVARLQADDDVQMAQPIDEAPR
jgi:anti-sigma factor RsiW